VIEKIGVLMGGLNTICNIMGKSGDMSGGISIK